MKRWLDRVALAQAERANGQGVRRIVTSGPDPQFTASTAKQAMKPRSGTVTTIPGTSTRPLKCPATSTAASALSASLPSAVSARTAHAGPRVGAGAVFVAAGVWRGGVGVWRDGVAVPGAGCSAGLSDPAGRSAREGGEDGEVGAGRKKGLYQEIKGIQLR